MRLELAKRQICRKLAKYRNGLDEGALFAEVECSIGFDEFLVAVAELVNEGILSLSLAGNYVVRDDVRAERVAAA